MYVFVVTKVLPRNVHHGMQYIYFNKKVCIELRFITGDTFSACYGTVIIYS